MEDQRVEEPSANPNLTGPSPGDLNDEGTRPSQSTISNDKNANMSTGNKGVRSKCWEYFERLPEDRDRARCIYCNKILACNSKKNGTSNLKNHILDRMCPKYPYPDRDDKQKKLKFEKDGENSNVGSLKSIVPFDVEVIRKKLAEMIMIDELAFRHVEGEGFRNFCTAMQPRFQIPSRMTVARDCMKIFLEERVKLMKVLRCQRVCLTTDTWTSKQNISYMALTAHWIDESWTMNKRVINFFQVPNHKGDTIGKGVEACLLDWGIDKIFTLTVDNASSNDLAIKYLKQKTSDWKDTILGHDFLHMRCCAHILNLIVKEGLSEQDMSIRRIRTAVRYCRSSPSRSNAFKKCVEKAKISSKSLVSLDVETRWNSTYLMLENALKFVKAFDRLKEDDRKFTKYFTNYEMVPPDEDDWENARCFVKFLRLFYNATLKFSGSLYVTTNAFFIEFVALQLKLSALISSTDFLLSSMAKGMKIKFEKYWENLDNLNFLLYVAIVLDPRYKLKYAKFCFSKIYENDENRARTIIEKLDATLNRLYDRYVVEENLGEENVAFNSRKIASVMDIDDDDDVDVSTFLEAQFDEHLENEESIETKSEMTRYLLDACESRVDTFDILGWWKMNASKYPILSQMAKDVLSVPVSTVSSESAFSTSGRVLNSFRSSLSPKMVEALICGQNWLRSNQKAIDLRESLEDLQKYEEIEKECFSGKGKEALIDIDD